MDDIYTGIFSAMYEREDEMRRSYWFRFGFPRTGREVEFGETIRSAIETASEAVRRRNGTEVRPDAKYFLLLNLLQMLAMPILIARREDPGRVEEDAAYDVDLILRDASESRIAPTQSPSNDRLEISAHQVIDAVSRNWSKLRLSRVRIWDGNPREGM